MTPIALSAVMWRVRPLRGTAVSLGLHALLFAALLLAGPLRSYVAPPPAAVSVEIVSPAELARLVAAPPPPVGAPTRSAADVPAPVASPTDTDIAPLAKPAPATPAQSAMHEATRFFAGGILTEPGMGRIRRAFGTLAASEKLVQLCNIEGLEQIRRAAPQYDPDTLVGYAMADTSTAGLTLTATGGAFRSRRKWYGVSFSCTAAATLDAITDFRFTLGDPIPEEQWEDHNLNAEDADE